MNWVLLPLRRYFQMSGRARRREFWAFHLALFVVQMAVAFAFGSSEAGVVDGMKWWTHHTNTLGDMISNGIGLLTFIPSLTVTSRRLHDVDRSVWWLLLAFIPIFGWLVLLVFLCLDGTSGTNRFGPDPKARDLGEVFR